MTDEERKQRKKEAQAQWVAKNPDYFRDYRRLNRDANAEYQRKYLDRGDNRQKHNDRQRKHQRDVRIKKCIEQLEKENIV